MLKLERKKLVFAEGTNGMKLMDYLYDLKLFTNLSLSIVPLEETKTGKIVMNTVMIEAETVTEAWPPILKAFGLSRVKSPFDDTEYYMAVE